MKIITYGLLLTCLCALAACGQSGSLYLPDKPTSRNTQSDKFLLPTTQPPAAPAKTVVKR